MSNARKTPDPARVLNRVLIALEKVIAVAADARRAKKQLLDAVRGGRS